MGQSRSINKALKLFVEYEATGIMDQEDSIEAIFNAFDLDLDSIRSSYEIMRAVVFTTRKVVIKAKKHKQPPDAIMLNNLKNLKMHIKKHRTLYDFIAYSRILEKRYKYVFNNQYIVEDIYKKPDLYDYSKKGGDYLVKFFKLLQSDLGKITRFETKLHSRYSKFKCLNYSLKIECVKARNEILFHPWYKHRLRRGSEFFADAFSPIIYLCKAFFHVVPSVFCIMGLTLSTSLGGAHPNQD